MTVEKSKISARVVTDSVNFKGQRLTTFVLKYPRFILAEANTHRAWSRNSASSRAIPVSKILKQVREDPAMPVHWGKLQKGMQAGEELSKEEQVEAKRLWLEAAENACQTVEKLVDLNLHKQVANRLLEPWMWMETIMSATDLGNFFNLRVHKDAQPEFQVLAYRTLEAFVNSTPTESSLHLPFGDKYLKEGLTLDQMIKIAVARCARVSYKNFEGEIDHQKDYELHDSLVASGHMSPCEHVAFSAPDQRHGNFYGWQQYRQTLPNENKEQYNSEELMRTVFETFQDRLK